ncbi:MAG: hypothetical protein WC822_03390 [Candidatus Paceibacterota bacterium]|jgi:hypothetical protein
MNKNYFKKNLHKIALIAFTFFYPVLSLADSTIPVDSSVQIINPISSTSIIELIRKVLEGVIKIGMPIIVLAVIYCGFLFVQAQGKPAEIEKARSSLLYTLIGAAILIGSWAIAQLIADTVKAL